MAKGNKIIVTAHPQGKVLEGTVTGALVPGIVVQIDVSEGLDDNGNLTWEPYAPGTDGNQRLIGVLLHNSLNGKISTDAYATGDHCRVYIPLPGDELNCIVGDVAGTGDDHSFGDILMVDTGTGELVATTGTPESEPFILLEAITDPTADTLAHVMFTGY